MRSCFNIFYISDYIVTQFSSKVICDKIKQKHMDTIIDQGHTEEGCKRIK